MFSIFWDEKSMGTGVATIDEQHKQLVSMLNQFISANLTHTGKDELRKMLRFLGDYAQKHFAHEESIMDEHRCPFAAQNKSAHEAFVKVFTNISERLDREGTSQALVMEVQQKVAGWLTSHMRGCDAKLRACINKAA